MSEEKICKDCKHYCKFEVPGHDTIHYCLRQRRTSVTVDIVTGETRSNTYGELSCYDERRYFSIGNHCSHQGRFWEAKE